MVVVDRLFKYTHFYALQHPFTPINVVKKFINYIFKLHGMSTSIVLDCDPTFIGKFSKELFKHLMRTHYHPQAYVQIKVVNKCVETYM